ncbi:MAG: Ppx/GppA family phosphatase, partial [Hyphomicrobiales bacterium]|nr:Ppx/GppA family phosphatase [Hyphomicrobiales bacterium]
GGGSSELVWLARGAPGARIAERMKVWISMPLGVVTLAEEFGGEDVDEGVYEAMVARVTQALAPFLAAVGGERERARFHHLGTSGTVTTVAGVHLGLQRYERRLVDGVWLDDVAAAAAVMALRRMDYAARRAHGCIGPARADLVLAGCAIYDAIRRAFPAPRLRVADRGLREGILSELMAEDGIDHG